MGTAGAKNGTENLFASAGADDAAGDIVVKLVNYSASPRPVKINLAGVRRMGKTGWTLVMASNDLNTQNSLQVPKKLTPQEMKFPVPGPDIRFMLAPNSLTVLRVPGRR